MTPERPTHINAGPYTYTIVYDGGEVAKVGMSIERHLMGSTEHRWLKVAVDPQFPEIMIRETLWHEVMHIAYTLAGLSHNDEPDEEQIVGSITPQLLDIMRRNPDLMIYIMDGYDERWYVGPDPESADDDDAD